MISKSVTEKPESKLGSCPSLSPGPSPSPTTPSPLQYKPKKPLLVIGASPVNPPEKKSYGEDVVGRRIKIYWPLDKSWYEGSVKLFDKDANKHLVEYDDAEEELLDLGREKIEWVEKSVKKKFKRLRRASPESKEAMVENDDVDIVKGEEDVKGFKRSRQRGAKVSVDDEEMENVEESEQNSGVDDDSSDEDWGKNIEDEVVEDGMDDMDLEEEDEDEGGVTPLKGKHRGPGKRKVREREKRESATNSKNGGSGPHVSKGGVKISLVKPPTNVESKCRALS